MTTATKPRPKSKTPKPNGQPAGPPVRQRVERRQLLPLDLKPDAIDRSPYQPRQDFPDEEIQALADSIAAQGQLAPILVRPGGGPRFELVDGERRLRAVRRLGLNSIRAESGDFSDAEVRAIVLASALQRQELNAIEEARAFRAALDAGDAPGPTELARQLGLSQGHVSNRLRLLELPEAVQAKVISREIPPTHARLLAPLKDHPQLCEAAVQEATAGDEPPTLDDVRDAIGCVLHEHGRRIQEKYVGGHVLKPKFTDAERAALGIVAVEGFGGHKHEYATNAKLYDQLLQEKADRTKARAEKRAAKNGQADTRKAAAQKLSPEEERRLEEERREKAAEQARHYAERLWHFSVDWTRYALAKALRAGEIEFYDVTRLLVVAAAEWAADCPRYDPVGKRMIHFDGGEIVADRVKAFGGKPAKGKRLGMQDVWRAVRSVENLSIEELAGEYLASCLFTAAGGPVRLVDEDQVLAIAADLEIDLGMLWSDEQCGPLSEQYWGLHTREQLEELSRELNVSLEGASKRADMIQRFLDYKPADEDDANTAASKALPYPKELAKCKRPK